MVDKERRKKMAFQMRQLSVGVISNDDFESNVWDDITHGQLPEHYHSSKYAKNDDPVIVPILELCWGLYSDLKNHKLKGPDELSSENLRTIARCILFLHTELEYEWPFFDAKSPLYRFSISDYLICLLTLGQNFRNQQKAQFGDYEAFIRAGDFDYWPFFRRADYEQALVKQPFLAKNEA